MQLRLPHRGAARGRKRLASLRMLVNLGMAGGLLSIASGLLIPAEKSQLKIWVPFGVFDVFAVVGASIYVLRPDPEPGEQIDKTAATVAAIWLPLPIGASMHAFAYAIGQETDMPPDHFSNAQAAGWYILIAALIAYGLLGTLLYFRSLDRGGDVQPKRFILAGWAGQLALYAVWMAAVVSLEKGTGVI